MDYMVNLINSFKPHIIQELINRLNNTVINKESKNFNNNYSDTIKEEENNSVKLLSKFKDSLFNLKSDIVENNNNETLANFDDFNVIICEIKNEIKNNNDNMTINTIIFFP